jgi:hypothetical protein
MDNALKISLWVTMALAWVAVVILFIGACAVSTPGYYLDGITSFIWVVTVAWLCITAFGSTMVALSMRATTPWVAATTQGQLFFLAITIAWLGFSANTLVAFGERGSRYDVVLAGELLALLAAAALAVNLLLTDSSVHGSGHTSKKAASVRWLAGCCVFAKTFLLCNFGALALSTDLGA